MRTLISTALGLTACIGAAAAQEAVTEVPATALVGETFYAPVDPGAALGAVAEVPADWVALGVVAGLSKEGGALVVEMADGVGFGAEGVPVRVEEITLVPDADDAGVYFVVFDGDLRTLRDAAEDLAQDRAAAAAAADGELFSQDEEMAEIEGAEGADGMTEEGEPLPLEEDAAEPSPSEAEAPDVVVVDPEPTAPVEAAPADDVEVVVDPAEADAPDAAEPTREVDIADPDAPPIEDAENVVPADDAGDGATVPLLGAETEVTSPSQTAAVTGEEVDATAAEGGVDAATGIAPFPAPEDFAVADMATMDVTELLGVRVYDRFDAEVGEIGEWVGEDASGALPEAALIEVGGFLGLGERTVAVPTGRLTLMADADGNGLRVYTDLTEDEIEGLPEVE